MSHNGQAVQVPELPIEEMFSKVLSDSLRVRIVGECAAREMTPRSFRDAVGGAPLAKVVEAFELLVQYGWLRRLDAETADPSLEPADRVYGLVRRPMIDEAALEKFPDSMRALLGWRIFESLSERMREAMKADMIGRRLDQHLSWMPLQLDRQGWDAVLARVNALFHSLFEEQEAASRRMAESGEEPTWMTAGLLAFESPKSKAEWR